jgi:cysteinyl-tRNA synthetase
MAKSVGNIFNLHEAIAAHGRDALVLYFAEGHYRQPVEYSAERLEAAAAHARRFVEVGRKLSGGPSPKEWAHHKEAFFDALADDFSTPAALAAADAWVREANRAGGSPGDADLREMLGVLGLENLLDEGAAAAGPDEDAEALLHARERARAEKDYAEADRLRDVLASRGWQVRDSADGPSLVPIGP